MERVRRIEIYGSFREALDVISGVADRMNAMLADVPEDKMRTLPAGQQQAMNDARMAATFLFENAQERLGRMDVWRHKYSL